MNRDIADHPGRTTISDSAPPAGAATPGSGSARSDFWGQNHNLERFVRRYLRTEDELRLICALGERPAKGFSLDELSALAGGSPSGMGTAVISLEHEGIVVTRRQGRRLVATLTRSADVREMGTRLFRLCQRDQERSVLLHMVTDSYTDG